jgi:predicted alpha/beta-fold hydrolase
VLRAGLLRRVTRAVEDEARSATDAPPPVRRRVSVWRLLRIGVWAVAVLAALVVVLHQTIPPVEVDMTAPVMSRVNDADPVLAQVARKAQVMAHLNQHPFRPAWWLRNQHAQTMYNPIFRSGNKPPMTHERLDTPDDDFLDLYTVAGYPGAPRVLLVHGLEGDIDSFYIARLSSLFERIGWSTTVMLYRGCGREMNRAPRLYHMGETTDVDFVARTLKAREPEKPLYVVGISLGGNVVGKWLGEQGEAARGLVTAAAAISPPFNPTISAPHFHKILGGFYAWRFLRTLIPKAEAKAAQYPGLLDMDAIRACKDFYGYDTLGTARLHGFKDAEDYWSKVGSHQYLPAVRVPLLLLTSEDDPFNPPATMPRESAEASPWLHPQWTTTGGHVGFISGWSPWRTECWFEQQTRRFFQCYEALRTAEG